MLKRHVLKRNKEHDVVVVQSNFKNEGVTLMFLVGVLGGLGQNSTFGIINQIDPGCSHLVTLLQQIFTLSLSYKMGKSIVNRRVEHQKQAAKKKAMLNIPLYLHLAMVGCVIGSCFFGNLSLDFNLPLPLFFLIKCGNLVASMAVGLVFLQRKYSVQQVFSVLLVTTGLGYSTITSIGSGLASYNMESFNTVIGALLVFLALILNAMLGAVQEFAFHRYQGHIDESTFMTSFLFVPLYLTLNYSSISTHAVLWFHGGWLRVIVPLFINSCCAHICRHAMYEITGRSSSLTATYAATTYRFSAIVASSLQQAPNHGLWVGVGLVLVGTLTSFHSETEKQLNIPETRKLDSNNALQRNRRNKSVLLSMSGKNRQRRAVESPRKKSLDSQASPKKMSPQTREIARNASAPTLSSVVPLDDDDDLVFEEYQEELTRMMRASSLHSDLDLLQSIRYSV